MVLSLNLSLPRSQFAAGLTVLLAVATLAFSVMYYVLLESEKFGKLRSVFDSRPWRNRENVYLATSSGSPAENAASKNTCPFSNKAAKGICPICCASTSRDGYHHVREKKSIPASHLRVYVFVRVSVYVSCVPE